MSLGSQGDTRCRNFVPLGVGPARPTRPRSFTIRLHFAELSNVEPSTRVFDVKLQNKTVLKDFDIASEAGGVRKALVREFEHVQASDTLTLEFTPRAQRLTIDTVPIVSGIEVHDESFDVE